MATSTSMNDLGQSSLQRPFVLSLGEQRQQNGDDGTKRANDGRRKTVTDAPLLDVRN